MVVPPRGGSATALSGTRLWVSESVAGVVPPKGGSADKKSIRPTPVMEMVKRVRMEEVTEEEVGESISTVPSEFVGGSSGQHSIEQYQQQSNSTVPSGAPVFSHGQGGQGRVRTWGGRVRNQGHTRKYKQRQHQQEKKK